MTTVAKRSIRECVDYINSRLEANIQQGEKQALCVIAEKLLMNSNMYAGFSNNYWTKQGYREWMESGQPEGPEKKKFIIGPIAAETDPDGRDQNLVMDLQGEYSRTYGYK